MNSSDESLVVAVVAYLEERGFLLTRTPGGFAVSTPRSMELPLRPVLTISDDLLRGYLDVMSRDIHHEPDAFAEALSLTKIHLVEALSATADPEGINYLRGLGFRRGRRGDVEFFVEHETPDGAIPPGPPADLEWRAL